MKNFIYLLITSFFLISCSESISDNSPALQGFVDNVLFLADGPTATQDGDGGYIIKGSKLNEGIKLRISDGAEGIYPVGGASSNYATYNDATANGYLTNPNGNGQIVVSNFNTQSNTISGSFRFDAIQTGVDTVFVKNGVFFEVPFTVTSEVIVDPEDPEGVPVGPCNSGTFVSLVDEDPLQQGNNLCVQAVIFQEKIVITATDPDDEVQLRMPLTIDTGQNILPKEGFTATYKDLTTGTLETLTVGNIVILSHNTTANLIRGSFSFETPNHVITIGSFNVTYQ